MGSKVKVRLLSEEEVQYIQHQLKSKDAFTVRRSQILLASHEGQVVSQIARSLRIATQTVRNTFRAFEADGLASLHEKSHRPHSMLPHIDESALQRLHALLQQKPRDFGMQNEHWTLEKLAQVSFEQGITSEKMSYESMRRALKRLDVNWKRATSWITSQDPNYTVKKTNGHD
ncbi:helix-turn-helix domain-containing protein [Deinococcus roseus]|uniref:Transposase n=1 Tax=Deinococcus roseus TaxID=392414 RepID=A0ABQ2D1I3_9DEIO|nr:helix-turn-helix domain-containing protein [Deinococcus roseus]GGJ41764.1 hypothetical protein GCM10008938_29790 [Deinococcus roseus]